MPLRPKDHFDLKDAAFYLAEILTEDGPDPCLVDT